MRKEALVVYVHFGGVIQYLRYAGSGTGVHGDGLILDNLAKLEEYLGDLELPVSHRLVSISGLDAFRQELRETQDGAKLTDGQAKKLKPLMRQMSDTIFSESSQKSAYIVGPKRWDTNKLLEAPADLFSPGIYDGLPDAIRQDLENACRCIAFELPTSAAFHLMRAVEALLREFYCFKVKRNRVDPLLWGPMIKHLRDRSKPPSGAVLDQLDHIRLNFRNPTQHPDAFYDIQEAQDLFGICIDAIHRVSREM